LVCGTVVLGGSLNYLQCVAMALILMAMQIRHPPKTLATAT
jgi:hypothetical protein